MIALSVVVPAYNEAFRILPTLQTLCAFLDRRNQPYEVLVVDDGSTDQTVSVVEAFRRHQPHVRVVRLPCHAGKGGAVRTGILEAKGLRRLIADADGATPIQELTRLETELLRGADIAIGSRYLASRDPQFHVIARWHRTILGNSFNAVVQRLGIRGITDTQCGFKLLTSAAATDLFSVMRIDGFGFDLELLYLAQRRGYRIAEVPIHWCDQPGSKVSVFRDGFQMLGDLMRIRRMYAFGGYHPSSSVPLPAAPFMSPASHK
jgi:dolichyl-phosphate beta-glucosyltransferase